MATAKGEVTTVLTYGDIKQTWIIDEIAEISPEAWENIVELFTENTLNWEHKVLSTPQADKGWVFNVRGVFGYRFASGWCMPSREGLHTGISREEAEGLWIDNPSPVEEDNVFAPREAEVLVGE